MITHHDLKKRFDLFDKIYIVIQLYVPDEHPLVYLALKIDNEYKFQLSTYDYSRIEVLKYLFNNKLVELSLPRPKIETYYKIYNLRIKSSELLKLL